MPKLSIKTTIPITFVVPLLACVGILGATAVFKGQHTAKKFSQRSMVMLNEQIKQKLNNFLDAPHIINKINTDAIELGHLDLQNYRNTELFLWRQIQAFKNVNSIQFGYASGGELRSILREEKDVLLYNIADKSTKMKSVVYIADAKGNRTKEIGDPQKYDARTREWYQVAVQAKKSTWTPIFQKKNINSTQLRISAVKPVYDHKTGKLVGVWAVDFFLNQISDFLVNITNNTSRQIFIVEPSGKLVAASTKQKVFDSTGHQYQAKDFDKDPTIKATAEFIEKTIPGGFANIRGQKQLNFHPSGSEPQLVNIMTFMDDDKSYKGLDWLVVTVVPQKEFLQDVHKVRNFALVMAGGVLLFSSFLGILVTRWLAQPILDLSGAARQITSADFDLETLQKTLQPIAQRPDELGELAKVFQQMAQEVYEREIELKNKVNQLADKANRTALAKQSDVHTLLMRSQKVRDKV